MLLYRDPRDQQRQLLECTKRAVHTSNALLVLMKTHNRGQRVGPEARREGSRGQRGRRREARRGN